MAEEAPHVVIVGAGFAGLRVAQSLARSKARVTVVDQRNYHLFQPLLYQVAIAGLSPADIARPVRTILRDAKNIAFRLACVQDIDLDRKRLETSTGAVDYDVLVLAPGGVTNFFGLDSVEAHGLSLKDIPDAVAIKNQLLRMFELAVQEPDADRRRALLTFVVVGGGPTGVECSGALSELVRHVIAKDFPNLSLKDVRVILLEATDRLLSDMPARLRDHTAEILWKKHVEVRFGARVTHFDGSRVVLQGDEIIPAQTLIWAAGVQTAPLLKCLGAPPAPQGRVGVRPTLQLPDRDEVFVIGDAAYLEVEGRGLPMMAPVAIQQARYAARNVRALLEGRELTPFRYRDPGSLAQIGRNAAVARLGRFAFHGFLAWILWLVVHIAQLIGFRNRLIVLVNWAWDYLFYERSVGVITSHELAGDRVRQRAPDSRAKDAG